MTTFWQDSPGGVTIMVKVQPKSRRPGVLGVAPSANGGQRLRLGVSEPAEAGRANEAVVEMLADLLAVPRGAVTIEVGATSREKMVRVTGHTEALRARLAAL